MLVEPEDNMTQMIKDWRHGSSQSQEKLNVIIHDTLKRIADRYMKSECGNHALQATVLANDAFMHLVDADIDWADRAHFRGVAAIIMRRSLIDHARARQASKRGGDVEHLTLMESQILDNQTIDILELDNALEKLAAEDERKAKAIELTFFGGLNYEEVAEVLAISKATVERELRFAKAWLYKTLAS